MDKQQDTGRTQVEAFFVGRQPIFDREQRVIAYELLYRSPGATTAQFRDGDRATSEVIINSILDMGLDEVVGQQPAFFNLTDNFVSGERPLPLDPRRVVLEVLESVTPGPQVIAGLRRLADQRFVIALDDFVFSEEFIPLLEIAHIVKLDVMGCDEAALRERVERLAPYKLKLLAEKVETLEEYEACKALGFHYFQGYFLCKPHIVEGRRLPANRLVVLNLLAKLQDPGLEMADLETQVIQDASLTYRLLRYINSSAFGLAREVDSVRRALILIGINTIRNWVSLLLLAGIEDKPRELMRTALVRGRMCEKLATASGMRPGERFFTVGLFSLLDALMDQPLDTLLAALPLVSEVKEALLKGSGDEGAVLQQVIAYEQGAWGQVDTGRFPVKALSAAYLEAIHWADTSMGELQRG